MFSRTVVRALGIICVSSHSFGIKTIHPLFFGIPYYVRKVLTNFENCTQPVELVGKPNQSVHKVPFSEITVRVICIVWVSSHSFGVRIIHRLFFWFPYFVNNVLTNFQNFYQPARPVGELDQPVC